MNERYSTYRNKNIEEVLKSGKLRNELLHHFTEGLKDGVVVYAGQIEARVTHRAETYAHQG